MAFQSGEVLHYHVPPKKKGPVTSMGKCMSKKNGHIYVNWHGYLDARFVTWFDFWIVAFFGQNEFNWPMDKLFREVGDNFKGHGIDPVDGIASVCDSGAIGPDRESRERNAAAKMADFFGIPVKAPTGEGLMGLGSDPLVPKGANELGRSRLVTVKPWRN